MHTDSMRMTMDQIVDETREWSEEDVAELGERIKRIKYGDIAPAIELAWHEELQRRIADLESGRVRGNPLEEALARALAIVLIGELAGG